MQIVRTRFAPSPTGYLHIGGLRTALYNYLFAKKNNGEFIVRMEDTDKQRCIPDSEEKILHTLKSVGLKYNEGPDLGGKYEPYTQSKRLNIYKKYAEILLKEKKAYKCFCSIKRLTQLRLWQTQNHLPSKYDRKCSALSETEINKRIKSGEHFVVRLLIPDGPSEIIFNDIIRGKITVPISELDDQVLLKSDGFPTYHLANVIDDHLMCITHVIRGEEWISSTPKHIIIYRLFSWQEPVFAHLPLLLNPDRSKLSKRQGDVSVDDFLNRGYLPEAIINFVALLGWNPKGNQEIYSLNELVKFFDLSKINKGGAVFNKEKLKWLNHYYIKQLSDEKFIRLSLPYLKKKKLTRPKKNKKWWIMWANIEKNRINTMDEVGEETRCLFEKNKPIAKTMLIWKQSNAKKTIQIIHELINFFKQTPIIDPKSTENQIKQLIKNKKMGVGDTLWPLRVALSGRENSPGPFELAVLLGNKESILRLENALKILKV